ncbi:non-structural maintenance of chromosomes element 3 homolog [Pieris rapae]|uniref:non-structural maintenance of chromosomes element 3 homolog n=1 Tax=Pieris rapae TaxID=64459 RepID=UPI000B927BBE|nr:non-structural maintenance of chromosomes element 3 homolog [Pieris rapae]
MVRGTTRKEGSTSRVEESPNTTNAVPECVRYILCREGSKVPIKRSEIKDYLSTSSQISQNDMNSIILEAERILKKIYGFKLVQIASKSGVQYIVILAELCEDSLLSTVTDVSHRQLLISALTHIFMSGGTVKDDDMWNFLTETGLLKETDNAGRKIITNLFTKQLYLKYIKVGENELARYVFEWGQRAIEEVPKIFLLNKMAQAFQRDPKDWIEQYQACTVMDSSA